MHLGHDGGGGAGPIRASEALRKKLAARPARRGRPPFVPPAAALRGRNPPHAGGRGALGEPVQVEVTVLSSEVQFRPGGSWWWAAMPAAKSGCASSASTPTRRRCWPRGAAAPRRNTWFFGAEMVHPRVHLVAATSRCPPAPPRSIPPPPGSAQPATLRKLIAQALAETICRHRRRGGTPAPRCRQPWPEPALPPRAAAGDRPGGAPRPQPPGLAAGQVRRGAGPAVVAAPAPTGLPPAGAPGPGAGGDLAERLLAALPFRLTGAQSGGGRDRRRSGPAYPYAAPAPGATSAAARPSSPPWPPARPSTAAGRRPHGADGNPRRAALREASRPGWNRWGADRLAVGSPPERPSGSSRPGRRRRPAGGRHPRADPGGGRFRPPGLAIVDEQHRFGVAQRLALRKKGGNPHQLMMSATPIPRTLAMSYYADLDVTVLDELPRPQPGQDPAGGRRPAGRRGRLRGPPRRGQGARPTGSAP